MTITITDDFDLEKIAESGQCFRWKKIDDKVWRIITSCYCVYVTDLGAHQYLFDCTEDSFSTIWMPFFDLQENYQLIRQNVIDDPFLQAAINDGIGIRILRQNPWEMLITFIISQNRNIPTIQHSVELLSAMCGNKLYDTRGATYYSFPSPEQLSSLTKEQLIECRLGYRWKYVNNAAVAVKNGTINLSRMQDKSYEDIIRELTTLLGVGNKVANCVALFGYHKLNAFPEDIWINRIMTNEYPKGYPFALYSPYNGVYQQYMFAYYRKIMSNKSAKRNI